MPDPSTSFYFATVTYTTLGHGDIVLSTEARIVATFCAITGLLTFGISTAFLTGVLSRILPDMIGELTRSG
ncbi:ion channel [Tateyamaria omphalii]|uniref:ion channel n=1 Tax=Tateyamaria omphalii TaxID=299262 RepID=UPI0039658A44